MKIKIRMKIMSLLMIVSMILTMFTVVVDASGGASLNKKKCTIYVGSTVTLKMKNVDTTNKIKWKSSNKKIATVSKGNVNAKKAGKVKITATVNKKKYTCNVTVKNPYLNKKKATLELGDKLTLKLTGSKVKKWSSNNKAVATVSSSGKITTKGPGNAIITALAANKKKYVCNIKVTHEHDFDWDSTKDPTCTQGGYELYVCECGASYKEDTEPCGHDYEEEELQALTCTNKGITRFTCKTCKHAYEETKEPTGHKFDEGEITREATCTRKGIKVTTCEQCDKHVVEYIDSIGHDYTEAIIVEEPTCDEPGLMEQTCINCLETLEIETEPLGHKYELVETVESTCLEEGYSLYRCTVCEDEEERDYQQLKEHVFDAGEITEESTCENEGIFTYTCEVCGEKKTEALAKIEHEFEITEDSIQPTCTKEGTNVYRCTMCDLEKEESVASLGHEYTDEIIEPSCIEEGYTLHSCTRCEESYKDAPVAKKEHNFVNMEVTEQPTCEEEGLRVYTCATCNEKKEESIASLGHDYVSEVIAPMCEEDGYTLHTCTRCEEEYQDNVVAKTGHSYSDAEVLKKPTCTETGLEVYVCKKCNEEKEEIIAANGHSYSKMWVNATNNTSGYDLCTCVTVGCDASYKDYSESRIPTILDNWFYTIYDDEGIINLDKYRGATSTPTSIYLPGTFTIDGVEYKTTLGYGKNAESTDMFTTYNRSCVEKIMLHDVTLYDVCDIFRDMANLTTAELKDIECGFDASLTRMFMGCSSLKEVDLSEVELRNVGSTQNMFKNCSALEKVKFSSYNSSSSTLVNIGGMFENCTSLTTLENTDSFVFTNVRSAGGVFANCPKLVHEDFNFISGQMLETGRKMFYGCSSLKKIYLQNVWLSEAESIFKEGTIIDEMFSECVSLKNVYVNDTLHEQIEELGEENALGNSTASISVLGRLPEQQ